MKTFVLAALMVISVGALNAGQILLADEFGGSTVNVANWQSLLPFSGSTVSQGGGAVTLFERGTLLSQTTFAGSIRISGTFTMNSDLEHFNIAARTDGSIPSGNGFAERTGIIFSFSNDGDQISIQQFSSNGFTSILAMSSYVLTTGRSYDFTATLDGTALSLSVDGVAQLTAIDGTATGDRIAIYSREGFGASTSVDGIAVSSIGVPDMVGTLGLLGFSCGTLCVLRGGFRLSMKKFGAFRVAGS